MIEPSIVFTALTQQGSNTVFSITELVVAPLSGRIKSELLLIFQPSSVPIIAALEIAKISPSEEKTRVQRLTCNEPQSDIDAIARFRNSK